MNSVILRFEFPFFRDKIPLPGIAGADVWRWLIGKGPVPQNGYQGKQKSEEMSDT